MNNKVPSIKKPELVTFASSEEEVLRSIDAGSDHLVLEDSKLSLRSFSDDFKMAGFDKIKQLALAAKEKKPDIVLSFNCDILAHEHHFPLIKQALETLRTLPLSSIRVQDMGLLPYLKVHYPQFRRHFAAEIGNHNRESVSFFNTLAERQILSNELPYVELSDIIQNTRSEYEIQVHGPILIQYSYRRFLAGLEAPAQGVPSESYAPIIRIAQDQEYPGRHFQFYDNPHGHLMYLYFDRCLISYLPQLFSLNLHAWLIDSRGESEAYRDTAIRCYKQERDAYLENPSRWALSPKTMDMLTSVSRRPLKGGFFRANQTDQTWRVPLPSELQNLQKVGTVVDSIKGRLLTLECEETIQREDVLTFWTPDHRQIHFPVHTMWDLRHQLLASSEGHLLIQLPWIKGVIPKSQVFKMSGVW